MRDEFGLGRKKDPPTDKPSRASFAHRLESLFKSSFFSPSWWPSIVGRLRCVEKKEEKNEAYNLIDKAKAASAVTHFHTKTLSRCTKVDWEIFSSDPRAILNKFSSAYTAYDTRTNVKERKTIGVTFFCSARALAVCSTLFFKWWSQRRKIVSKEKIYSTQAELVHECWACKPRCRQI